MTIQFPADKFVNDTYDYNGLTYVWDGEKWTASGAAAFEDAYVNVTGDTMTGDLTVPSLNGGPLAGFRNQIINGDFRVWQRGTNVTTQISSTSSKYISADRFSFVNRAGTQNVRVARNGNPIVEAPAAYSLQIDSATVSLQDVRMIQGIELDRTGGACQFTNGSTWTVSVYSDQDLTSRTPGFGFADNTIRDNNTAVTGVESWQSLGGNRYKSTFTIDVDPVATNTIFYFLDVPPDGATRVNYACLQLEPGPVATPFEHRPYATELALCQRYFQKRDGRWDCYENGGKYVVTVDYPVSMRTLPTISDVVSPGFTPTNQIGYLDHAWFEGTQAGIPKVNSFTADAEL